MSRKESEDYGENRRNVKEFRGIEIGLVTLMGLAAKNAILIVEFAKIQVNEGIDPATAAIRAGNNIMPAVFGVGCMNSHGYERTRVQAIEDCARLILAYVLSE